MRDDDLDFNGNAPGAFNGFDAGDPFDDAGRDEEDDFEDFDGREYDEDADLYLDESDRGSAQKRRYTTRRHALRKDNPRIRRRVRRSADRSARRRQAALAARQAAGRQAPRIAAAANRLLQRRIADTRMRRAVARLLASRFVTRAAQLAASRAGSAVTARQIIRLPVLSILSAAAVEVARKTGRIDEEQARSLAQRIFDALSIADMAIQIGSGMAREEVEDEDLWEDFEGEEPFDGAAADLFFESEDDEGDDEDFAGDLSAGGLDASGRGRQIAAARALRDAARQLLRAERRLSGRG
ncbi:hypothetical protein ACFSUD_11960 [Sulfitobacter aestuarii]|uniref:Uncharacterized protein n=1 Tax=Sulfitobacter aestuarii TaxID=2161676 RepID=A0ABW5U6D4_9RHOB